MNNNIIRYLRLTMLSSVAAVVVSIGFTACTDDTFVTEKQNAAPVKSYKFNIPANMGGDQTRAIAYNSQTGGYDATFETTDYIAVYNITKKAYGNNGLNPYTAGKTTNLVGDISFSQYNYETGVGTEVTPEVGDELYLGYKGSGMYYSRNFTDEWESEADFALAKVKITAINDGAVSTSSATFINQQSIYSIKFTGIPSGVKIKKVLINSAQNKLVSGYYPNEEYVTSFGDVSYIYAGEGTDQHTLNFMLRFDNPPYNDPSITGNDVINFRLIGSDGHYYMGAKEAPANGFENSKYYEAEIAAADAGLALTLTNDATGKAVDFNVIIDSQEGAYTLTNNGYDAELEWHGGPNTLTMKNVTIRNSYNVLRVTPNFDNTENSREHILVLDGNNTLCSTNGSTGLSLWDNCSLTIKGATASSTLNFDGNTGLTLGRGSIITIQSGTVNISGYMGWTDESSIIITESGKLRGEYINQEIIKAANGYMLKTTRVDNYTEYSVTEAPPYEEPKALSEATAADIGKLIGSDGKVHVPHWDLPNGAKPVGVITYISETGHGLAIAMDNVKQDIPNEWGGYTRYNAFSWGNYDEGNNGKTAQEIFTEWANSNNVSFGTWRFPTKADLQNMILACRVDGDATEVNDIEMTCNGFRSILESTNMELWDYFDCWTSTIIDEHRVDINIYKNEAGANICYFYTSWGEENCFRILPVLEF